MRPRSSIFIQVIPLILFLGDMSLGAKLSSGVKPKSASLTGVSHGDDGACFNFSIGYPQKKEFYSPNYPNEYPKNTKCTFRITAPAGHMVMLDFRDQFHMEESATCEYDKLEVRDGAYGYSPLIGTYCGNEFPSKLLSSKRYMWLQFSSDDSIEYTGFRAVYDFVPVPNKDSNNLDHDIECSFHRTGSSGIIYKSEIDPHWKKYRQDNIIECMWTIETDPGKKLYINFNKYQLGKPNDCDQNFIQIFSDGRTPDKELNKFCGTTAEPQKSPGNTTLIRLFTHENAFNDTNFTLHYTSFREINKEEHCNLQTEFNCGDQTCVDIALKCDGQFDCKYRYDEESCATALGAGIMLTSEHMIVILVVFFALVVAMCASISISCYNKIKERQLREREYKERRSKEASLEATIERNVHSAPAAPPQQARFRDDEEESSDGCYVPQGDLGFLKSPSNGGDTIPKKVPPPVGQFPYISESFESLESDVIVAPAPPPVPPHIKELSPSSLGYRVASAKSDIEPIDSKGRSGYSRWTPQDSRPGSVKPHPAGFKPVDSAAKPLETKPTDLKSNYLRGPLEAGAPRSAFSRSPGEIALPKFGMARVTPDGPRGPLASKTAAEDKALPLATFRRPYEDVGGYRPGAIRRLPETAQLSAADASDKDSSRAHSVASSTLSAPDVIGKRYDRMH